MRYSVMNKRDSICIVNSLFVSTSNLRTVVCSIEKRKKSIAFDFLSIISVKLLLRQNIHFFFCFGYEIREFLRLINACKQIIELKLLTNNSNNCLAIKMSQYFFKRRKCQRLDKLKSILLFLLVIISRKKKPLNYG